MNNALKFLLGLPKTIIINFKYLPWYEALRLPIWVTFRCRLRRLKGNISIESPLTPGMIKIGYGDVGVIDNHERASFSNEGRIVFYGKTNLGGGTRIDNHGTLVFGKNFVATAKIQITCYKRIVFGESVLVSWDTAFMDTDTHKIFDINCDHINQDKEISIGNNVWIGTRCLVLKGTIIPDGCIVGANSLVAKKYTNINSVIAGQPAKEIKQNISWKI